MITEDEAYLAQLEEQVLQERENARLSQQGMAATMFGGAENENLVKWQLDIKEELQRIEHLLRKHVPKRDSNGQEYFAEPEKKDQLLNEHGVNFILNLLGWYLNKNIILSNFDDEQINLRVHQFARELTNYLHNNYEKMGLNNTDKLKEVPLLVLNLVNTVEAAYNRALHGGERESLRTARSVHQTEPLGGFGYPQQQVMPPTKKFSLMNPTSWTKS